MDLTDELLDRLATANIWRYQLAGPAATEPTALTALALLAHGHLDEARRPLDWLAQLQSADGSLGVTATQSTPGWPTSLAVIAWQAAAERLAEASTCAANIRRAVTWILSVRGATVDQPKEMGHNSRLVGWPWVEGTHSWVEPTAFHLMALKASGHGGHARAKEAATLLVDRLLPDGGCNCGNTVVYGQVLRPHVQPSGIALLALAGDDSGDPRIGRTIAYLTRELNGQTTTASLCYGLLGLTAHGCRPPDAESWLAQAARRTLEREAAAYKLALLALADCDDACPLFPQATKASLP